MERIRIATFRGFQASYSDNKRQGELSSHGTPNGRLARDDLFLLRFRRTLNQRKLIGRTDSVTYYWHRRPAKMPSSRSINEQAIEACRRGNLNRVADRAIDTANNGLSLKLASRLYSNRLQPLLLYHLFEMI